MRQAIKALTEHAEMKGWDIFSPDWAYIRQFPVLRLDALCALSVGLQQAFAVPAWTISKAMRHFEGYRPGERPGEPSVHVDVPGGASKMALLEEFHSRFQIAPANLKPRGSLAPAEGESPAAQFTYVRVTDFVAWAVGMGWDMPPELVAIGCASQKAEPVTKSKEHYADNLVYLIQAADRFWATADRDNAALQPKQEDVEKWLTERGYTPTLAKHAARIIRPSWAKDGRRPEDK